MKNEQTWQLTSYHNKHSYSKELKIGIMHAKWLSRVFLKKIAENPKIKLTKLMKKAYNKWNVELTKSKAFALNELQGIYIEQYKRLYDYCHELLRSNTVTSIHGKKEKYVVDLKFLECSCGKLLQKAKYIECYQHVYPVNGPKLWTKTPFDDVLPPVYRKLIGRPKSKRNKIANEHQTRGGVSKKGKNQKCRYCFVTGHNKRTCPKKHKVVASATVKPIHVNKVAGSISRRSSRGISSTISTQASQQLQVASKSATLSRPKRKTSTNTVSTQQSQVTSKRTKVIPSNNAFG
ncbi:hypothetical protein Ahy_A01g004410 [Arachis hypogaea]|uniref:Uncharacterized protein n=1 Tax=Arachis hypogaea TaxID=3818 RepID=A0A445EW10_ARAHY|nr:hypothetical protein Ahy_A01g004410 [Arachis hypogaea]